MRPRYAPFRPLQERLTQELKALKEEREASKIQDELEEVKQEAQAAEATVTPAEAGAEAGAEAEAEPTDGAAAEPEAAELSKEDLQAQLETLKTNEEVSLTP